MTFLAILVLIALAWLLPMFFIANMDKVERTEKCFWMVSVLPFSWFTVAALMISGPVMANQTQQNYRHL